MKLTPSFMFLSMCKYHSCLTFIKHICLFWFIKRFSLHCLHLVLLFFCIWRKKMEKTWKITQKYDFEQQRVCEAPICWLKYTTGLISSKICAPHWCHCDVFILTTEGSLVNKTGWQTLCFSGTYCHKTGTRPPHHTLILLILNGFDKQWASVKTWDIVMRLPPQKHFFMVLLYKSIWNL